MRLAISGYVGTKLTGIGRVLIEVLNEMAPMNINDEYILTAFSRFNKNNQAELTIQEYVNFLLTFWNEINRLYAQRSVTVPVFGSGITRFKNGFEDIDINELLRIMIWTFKVSKIKFAYPAKLTIIVHNDLLNQVNLYKLKENE